MDRFRYIFRNMSPWMLILIAIMFVENMMNYSGGLGGWIYAKCILLPGIVIGLSFHEAAHAYASYWLGDPTPKEQGRLTINPVAHIDVIGFVFLLIAGFGWGEPVQIDPRFYKHRRRDELIVSLAGVFMNLLVAVAFSFIVKFLYYNIGVTANTAGVMGILYEICYYTVRINLVLMCFNLIPCPPLDGFGVITQIFNLQKYEWWYMIYKNGSLILMLLIIFNITQLIITPACNIFMNLLF